MINPKEKTPTVVIKN